MSEKRLAGKTLTVVIRDDSPMVFCGDTPAYRSVRLILTDEQREACALRYVGSSGERRYYEAISKVFFEVEP